MSNKVKTHYKIKNNLLLKDDSPSGIQIVDDYFFKGEEALNIYLEDGQIFVSRGLLPILKWPMISKPTDLSVTQNGEIFGMTETCIFDQLLDRKK